MVRSCFRVLNGALVHYPSVETPTRLHDLPDEVNRILFVCPYLLRFWASLSHNPTPGPPPSLSLALVLSNTHIAFRMVTATMLSLVTVADVESAGLDP